jgi:hypothetical protein
MPPAMAPPFELTAIRVAVRGINTGRTIILGTETFGPLRLLGPVLRWSAWNSRREYSRPSGKR